MTTTTAEPGRAAAPALGQLNSIQLNIVTLVHLQRASATGTLEGSLFMMDNSVGGTGQGTGRLETVCKQGQVLNWIIRPIEMDKRPDGNWPPMPKITSLVFLDPEETDAQQVATKRITSELKIYGMPDKMRSPYTPVYYYWAGTILPTAQPGLYRYRLVVELEQDGGKDPLYLNTEDNPALRIIGM